MSSHSRFKLSQFVISKKITLTVSIQTMIAAIIQEEHKTPKLNKCKNIYAMDIIIAKNLMINLLITNNFIYKIQNK